jgi:hypothetical protein
MANPDIIKGFIPDVPERCTPHEVLAAYGTAIYPGDVVKPVAAGVINIAEAGSEAILGASADHNPASTKNLVLAVYSHPDQLFIAQDDASGAPAQTDLYNNCDHVATAGNSTLNKSNHEIAHSTLSNSNGGFRLLALVRSPDNVYGDNARWRVQTNFNEHHLTVTTGTN